MKVSLSQLSNFKGGQCLLTFIFSLFRIVDTAVVDLEFPCVVEWFLEFLDIFVLCFFEKIWVFLSFFVYSSQALWICSCSSSTMSSWRDLWKLYKLFFLGHRWFDTVVRIVLSIFYKVFCCSWFLSDSYSQKIENHEFIFNFIAIYKSNLNCAFLRVWFLGKRAQKKVFILLSFIHFKQDELIF